MYISVNWIKKYVDLEGVDIHKLFQRFAMNTAEVEGIEDLGDKYKNVVVAKVETVEKHPKADKLSITTVFDGKETRPVVCGAPNVYAGMYSILALPGAELGDFKIKKSKIRGVKSEGMLCSEIELGAGTDASGIIDLKEKLEPGTPAAKALGLDDIVVEVDNKSLTHRPDLWGHYGIAREVAAILRKPLKDPIKPIPKGGKGVDFKVTVKDPDLCPRYMATVIDNITVKPSPLWMQKLLTSAGCRPINNIVDITNFVMMELGQPLHAFDLNMVEGNEIIVRRAEKGEKLTLLVDEQEVELDEEILVIADAKKPVALAGVMGGEDSKINDDTKTVVMEAATFDYVNNRKTSMKVGVRTDSSARYEKFLDPAFVKQGASRFLELLFESCPDAKIVSDIFDEDASEVMPIKLELTLEYINRKLGKSLTTEEITEILEALQFVVKLTGEKFTVMVPTFRATKDVTQPIDLIEEIGRMYGYDNIEEQAPEVVIAPIRLYEHLDTIKTTREVMCRVFGFDEVYNYSFVGPETTNKLGLDDKVVKVLDPIDSNNDMLRTSLLPGILKNVALNRRNYSAFKLFEIGTTFIPGKDGEIPLQKHHLCSAVYAKGEMNNENFYLTREAIVHLGKSLKQNIEVVPSKDIPSYSHPARCADFMIGDTCYGKVFTLHPEIANAFEIEGDVVIAEFALEAILECKKTELQYTPIMKYPTVPFDVGVVADKKALAKDIFAVIKNASKKFVLDVNLFDVYEGKQIEEHQKSYACKVLLGSPKGTMTTKQIEKAQESIVKALVKKGYGIR